jgi:hypothetical protein
MLKKILFTLLLIIICVFSFYVGVRPFGPLAAWQDRNEKTQAAEEAKTESSVKAESSTKVEGEEGSEEIVKNKNWKSIHQSLNEKTDQLMNMWGVVKSAHGTVNVLYTTDVKAVYPTANPLEVLVPTNNILNRISNLFRWALTSLIFEKTLLTLSVTFVFLVLIPICALISIFLVWINKNDRKLHRLVISSVLICLVISVAVPVSLKLSTITDEIIFSRNVTNIISAMEENEKNSGTFNSELRRFRRTEASINDYLSTAGDLSHAVIRDSINYLQIFFMLNILIPALILIVLYKVTRFIIKLIMKN